MNIAILYTGGTIGCVGNPLAPMNTDDFSNAFKNLITPILRQQYPNIAIDFPPISFPESSSGTLDSTNLQPSDWCLMAEWVLNTYGQYDGWVVLHGTDSMDFTGPALSFLLSDCNALGFPTATLSKPVIITGSQVPLFHRASPQTALAINYNTDAFQNVCGAVAAAQSGVPEVGVYFQNQLYRGNRTVKTNASQFNAFSSPNYPALGEYGIELDIDFANVLPLPATPDVSLDTPATLSALQQRLAYIAQHIDAFPAMQFNAFPAAYSASAGTAVIANLIDACGATGIKGLVLESYGEGNFPSGNPDNPAEGAIYQALARADAAGVVIVDCTQVLSGTVNDSAYAAGAWLPSVGALSPADMTPMAALAKVIILSTVAAYHGWSANTVKTLVQTDLVGEMQSVNRLDDWSQPTLAAGQAIATLDGSATLRNDPTLGPVLLGSGSTSPLWQALAHPMANPPGRLVMEQDGNLAFYDRTNTPLWSTNIVPTGPTRSALVLGGSYTDETLSLYLYNAALQEVAEVLYDESGGS
ncbi:asparaginase domain-containing protein [Pseudogulbenkiania sp. MAI-1]|uniref:asparaginase domain-containing protein n=1 Tax=Pseudogulbenkiania sp. MAI-1 TaxID=990370 RepID=UPI00045EC3F3|nr:asparaginase domain-containing protein [Pseudogulbenkiania sp. MAI-1]